MAAQSLLHLVKIRLNVPKVIFTGGALPARCTRSIAMSHSSLLRNQARVVYGVSGRKKNVAKPTGTVIHFLDVSSKSDADVQALTPQTMYSHRHPESPACPSSDLYTAACCIMRHYSDPDLHCSTHKIPSKGRTQWCSHVENCHTFCCKHGQSLFQTFNEIHNW